MSAATSPSRSQHAHDCLGPHATLHDALGPLLIPPDLLALGATTLDAAVASLTFDHADTDRAVHVSNAISSIRTQLLGRSALEDASDATAAQELAAILAAHHAGSDDDDDPPQDVGDRLHQIVHANHNAPPPH